MNAGKYGLLDPKYGDNVTLLKLCNYLPADMLLHPRKLNLCSNCFLL